MSNQKNIKPKVDEEVVCDIDLGKIKLAYCNESNISKKKQRPNNLVVKSFHFVQFLPFFQVYVGLVESKVSGFFFYTGIRCTKLSPKHHSENYFWHNNHKNIYLFRNVHYRLYAKKNFTKKKTGIYISFALSYPS